MFELLIFSPYMFLHYLLVSREEKKTETLGVNYYILWK